MGDDFHLQLAPMPSAPWNEGIEIHQMLTGVQAVPQAESHRDPNDLRKEWRRHQFIYLVVDILKRAKVATKLFVGGPDESPSAFLQCLKDTIQNDCGLRVTGWGGSP
jgi:hypothetical protein